jgi:signal peptidase I
MSSQTEVKPERRAPVLGGVRRFTGGLFLLVCAALAAIMLLPPLLGYQRYVITGKSMTGTYDRGSVVFDKVVPTAQLKVGDVITYVPPPGSGPSGKVTHRIVSIRTKGGSRVYRTKGDANAVADPWTFHLDQPTQARVDGHVAYVGYVYAALSDPSKRFLVIGIPAILIAIYTFLTFFREAGEEARREEDPPPENAA